MIQVTFPIWVAVVLLTMNLLPALAMTIGVIWGGFEAWQCIFRRFRWLRRHYAF